MDDLESDFSVYHGMDMWGTSMATVMRLAPKLVVYGGALALALSAKQAPATYDLTAPEVSTSSAQVVDNGDTPPDQVAALWDQHLRSQYQSMGVNVTGIQPISDTEMEGLVNGGR